MSDETPCGGWTTDTLREHVTKLLEAKEERDRERFAAQEKLTALALAAANQAVSKAETATEKRLEGLNEFRATLGDQQTLLMPRNEVNLLTKTLEARVNALENERISVAGRMSGLNAGWLILVGALGFIGSLGTLVSLFKTIIK